LLHATCPVAAVAAFERAGPSCRASATALRELSENCTGARARSAFLQAVHIYASEIGGEGRNFQFCHHLILADLPLHPDALEQRIGRLDRIGQTETIQVHVAVVEGTPGEALFHWHRTMKVFDAPLTGGEHLMDAQAGRLLGILRGHVPGKADPAALAGFLAETEAAMNAHQAEVQASVDFLIDLNSFDQPLGQALAEEIAGFDQQLLQGTVSDLLEHFGVIEDDFADPRLRRIRPGNHMKVEPFPGLRSDGCLATYDRPLALAREELVFLSPDHELVEGALALLLDQAEGRASIARWPKASEQGVRLEFLFLLEAAGPSRLELPRFLPPASLVVTLDVAGRSRQSAREAGAKLQRLPAAIWARVSGHLVDKLPALLGAAEASANVQLAPRVQAAVRQAQRVVGSEQERLVALQALGNVAEAEVRAHAAKLAETVKRLGEARVSLDAVRVLLLDPST
jgi:ATP-dependent helicase HepA